MTWLANSGGQHRYLIRLTHARGLRQCAVYFYRCLWSQAGPVKEILCLHDLGFNECFLGSHNYGDCEGQIKSQSTVGVTSG